MLSSLINFFIKVSISTLLFVDDFMSKQRIDIKCGVKHKCISIIFTLDLYLSSNLSHDFTINIPIKSSNLVHFVIVFHS